MIDCFFGKSNMLMIIELEQNERTSRSFCESGMYSCFSAMERKTVLKKIKDYVLAVAIKDISEKIENSDILDWFQDRYAPFLNGKLYNAYGETLDERPMLIYVDTTNKRNLHIAGVCFMKRTKLDQRIAMIYVDEGYRKNGIAQSMLIRSHSILNLQSSTPYVYLNDDILKTYPFFPHVICKCGYTFASSENDANNKKPDFYFTMNRAYSNFLEKVNSTITLSTKTLIFGKIGDSK